ncbi:hypothetical protein [Ktedonobacter racemifer]|uniref:Extracellular ligand-binding receptor n=1 Tax=Ktedonobacter racemifer DSM 44963 TaxID=485913 RepID=D6TLW7_KTERA|nr:hypothetical protein [Ktedonobacter racemifer]EFH86767.1 extracellular ligand-binding receptor [Ktedonobacter racemifer DSM 44963]
MFRNMLRWIIPLVVLLIVITVVAIGSFAYTHAAGVTPPRHQATDQTTPTPSAQPDIYWHD